MLYMSEERKMYDIEIHFANKLAPDDANCKKNCESLGQQKLFLVELFKKKSLNKYGCVVPMWWLSAYGVTVELEPRSDRSSTVL